jgi:hypothetical protein
MSTEPTYRVSVPAFQKSSDWTCKVEGTRDYALQIALWEYNELRVNFEGQSAVRKLPKGTIIKEVTA